MIILPVHMPNVHGRHHSPLHMSRTLNILFLNPYHVGSHAAFADGYAAHSNHHITLATLPMDGGWRWRMRGAAVAFARQLPTPPPDLIITTDMLDVATFRALTRHTYPADRPMVLYFHENQLTYPLPTNRPRDLSFAWINYTSALTADAIIFNSAFHQRTLLAALPSMLTRHHDTHELDAIDTIAARASVLPPGLDLGSLVLPEPQPNASSVPVILWNSRWDYDKQPQVFFAALENLVARGTDFRLIIAGGHVNPHDAVFQEARRRWAPYLLHYGYAPDRMAYARLLHTADIVVSTAIQEFFGIGMMEALACGCIPLLPHRLSYPDLLPPKTHADCLYPDDNQLPDYLDAMIHRCADLKRYDWRSIALPYDWEYIAPRYDALLESLV